jgi:tryptophan 2,3-dioxygenase
MPSYSPQFPTIVDVSGVSASAAARPMSKTTDTGRAATAKSTEGSPLVDFGGTSNPYVDYQSIDLLLSLQHPRSPGYDETCFFIMGQVKELLFKALHFELYNAQLQLAENQVGNVLDILGRAKAYARYITDSWDVLSTISPAGFNEFRDYLGTASGQLSFMYRHVEFVLGNKNARLASAFRNMPHIWPGIQAALHSRSLYDEAIALLKRRGYAIDDAALDRDWSEPYSVNASVEKAWSLVYENSVPGNDLYMLAEVLVGLSDQISQYRWRHFVSVQRLIGFKAGTGGSAGVGWLQHVTEHRHFPELWSIRTGF